MRDSIVDHGVIGKFIQGLKKAGSYENTLIIVAGDHGYAILRHKQTLYDSGLKVPMIIKFPQGQLANSRENGLSSLTDLFATSL